MKEFGCIGEKLSHSFSKEIHARLAPYSYELCEVPREKLAEFFAKRDFYGINVTIPYKQDVIPFLDEISDEARAIGAVNTIVNRGGRLSGYNTDHYGMTALIRRAGIEVKNKNALVLGSGGTSKTAVAVLSDLGAKRVLRVSRTGREDCVTYEYAQKLKDTQIIVNTTPCGMFPNPSGTPVDIDLYPEICGVTDAVYNPLKTNLVLDAREKGIPASGGLFMLVAQAAKACELFTGQSVPDSRTENVFREICGQKENIVLTGMPGCGKSTVGRILSERTGKTFFDTDALFEESTGEKAGDYIRAHGEESFRDKESEVISGLSSVQGAVIATGGGAVLRRQNVRALKRNGRVVFINRPVELLKVDKSRPLSETRELLKKRYDERYGIYKNSADFEITGDKTPEETAAEILEMMK